MHAWLKFAQVTLRLWYLEWFTPLRNKNTSSSLMSHPNLLGLHPESFTSDWNQDPLKPNFAGGTVWPSGRLHPSHKGKRRQTIQRHFQMFQACHTQARTKVIVRTLVCRVCNSRNLFDLKIQAKKHWKIDRRITRTILPLTLLGLTMAGVMTSGMMTEAQLIGTKVGMSPV